jgi:hypothetical protein
MEYLPRDVREIIFRYAYKWEHRDLMKKNGVLYDIRGFRRFDDRIEIHNSEGKLHRDGDKPAVIFSDGSRWWYKEGKLHRDKPACIDRNGSKYWYKDGKLIKKE